MNQAEYHQFSRFFIPLNHHCSELHPIKPPFPMVKSALNPAMKPPGPNAPKLRVEGSGVRNCSAGAASGGYGIWGTICMYCIYIYTYTCAYCYYIIIVITFIIMSIELLLQQDPMAWKEERCSNMILMLTCVHHLGQFRHVHISSIPFSKSMHGTPWVSGINLWGRNPISNGFQVLETVARVLDKSLLHIHLDLDVLDPAEFPHVLPGETTIGPWVNKLP